MTMHDDKVLADKIWAGEPGAVEEARKRYEANPQKGLIPWASTLYSFRSLPRCKEGLQELIPRLQERVSLRRIESLNADQLDVISTILVWNLKTRSAINPALRTCARGSLLASQLPAGNHTDPLIALTHAILHMKMARLEGGSPAYGARSWLERAARLAPAIKDADQKMRVYRKLGAIHLKLRHPIGLWYLVQALLVKGASKGTFKKTLMFWKQ